MRGAEVAGRRVLLVDDAVRRGTAGRGLRRPTVACRRQLFSLVDMREVADMVTPTAAALPTTAISPYLGVLATASASGVLDRSTHTLAVDAIMNRWSGDDPRWNLLPGEY